jgi:hypothetical protein
MKMLIFQGGRVQDNWEKLFPYYLGLSILACLLERTLDLSLPLFEFKENQRIILIDTDML